MKQEDDYERHANKNSESRREAEMYKKRIDDLKKIRENRPSSSRRDEEVNELFICF